jgi:hypothetical protein
MVSAKLAMDVDTTKAKPKTKPTRQSGLELIIMDPKRLARTIDGEHLQRLTTKNRAITVDAIDSDVLRS